MPVAQERELISVAEAAKRFGVSGPAVREWIRKGYIKAYERQLPKQVFVDAREIQCLREIQPREE